MDWHTPTSGIIPLLPPLPPPDGNGAAWATGACSTEAPIPDTSNVATHTMTRPCKRNFPRQAASRIDILLWKLRSIPVRRVGFPV